MEIRRIGPDGAFVKEFKDWQKRIQSMESKPAGKITIRETLTTEDPATGVKTILGKLPDGSYGLQPFVYDITPPPIATAPVVVTEPGLFIISWDGLFAGAADQPRDFECCNIIGHKIVDGATVSSVPVGMTVRPLDITYVSTDVAAGGEVWQFSLEAEDYNGNRAEWSARSPQVTMVDLVSNVDVALGDLQTRVDSVSAAASAAQTAAGTAQTAADKAIADALAASNLAGTKGKVLVQSTAPTGVDANLQTLWIDTTGGTNTPKKWVSGTTWSAITDKVATDAAAAVIVAQSKADQAFNNAATAATAAGTAQTTADSKNRVWYQTTAPTGTSHKINDLWFDTDDGNKPYMWNGSAWVVAQDAAIAAAQSTANTALTSANGKNKVYYQTAMPTGGTYILGDTWFDTDDGNKIYVHNGTTFVASQDTSIAAAQTTANTAIASQSYSTNASFDDWTATYPTGYAFWNSTPFKETSIIRRAPFSARFNVADAAMQSGVQFTSPLSHAPNLEYFTVEMEFYLVSGGLGQAGMILDWNGLNPFRTTINLFDEVPSPATGKWYRVVKTLRRPTGAAGTFSSMGGYLMAQWSGLTGGGTAKDIIYDWFNIRPSTTEEITAYGTPASITTLTNTVNTKARTYFQTAQPGVTGNTLGDLWFDTDDGNKVYVWNGSAWTVAQDAAIAAAQTSANGKNRIYYQTAQPTGGTYVAGDTWFDTDDGNQVYVYNGTTWAVTDFGSSAIADLAITNAKIADATIQSAKIGSVDAGTISVGTLSAARIGADTITASHIASDAITANELAANSITAAKGQISDLAITTAKIADAQITNAKIADLAVTNAKIANATIQAAKIGSVDAGTISVGQLVAGQIAAGAITTTHMTSGTINASVLTAGSITAPKIAAKTITTDKLIITSTDNLAVEADFGNGGSSWQIGPNNTINATAGRGSLPAMRFTGVATTVTTLNLVNKFSVGSEDRFRGAMWIKSSATATSGIFKLVGRCYTTATAYSDIVISSNQAMATANTWTNVSGISPTLPAGTIAMELYLSVTNAATGTITDIDYVGVTRAADANLVVDGAIDGKTVTGATIQTAASGARIVLDQNSLNAWNTAGDNYFNMSNSTGVNISSVGAGGFDVTRINYCTNPSFEVDISGWTSGPGQTIIRDTAQFYVGTASLKATHTATADRVVSRKQSRPAWNDYTVSTYVRHDAVAARNMRIDLFYTDLNNAPVSSGTFTGTVVSVPPNTWTRLSVSDNGLGWPGAASNVRTDIVGVGFTSTETMWVDAVMWEALYNVVNPYFDGSTATSGKTAYVWEGSTGLSYSDQRTDRDIKIKTGGNNVLLPGNQFSKQAVGVGFIPLTPYTQTAGLFSDGQVVSIIEGASDPQLTRMDIGNQKINTWSYGETAIQARGRIYVGSTMGSVDISGGSGINLTGTLKVNGVPHITKSHWVSAFTQTGIPYGTLWGPGQPTPASVSSDPTLISWPSNDTIQFRDTGLYMLSAQIRVDNVANSSGNQAFVSFEPTVAIWTNPAYSKGFMGPSDNQATASVANMLFNAGDQIKCYMVLYTSGGGYTNAYWRISVTRIG